MNKKRNDNNKNCIPPKDNTTKKIIWAVLFILFASPTLTYLFALFFKRHNDLIPIVGTSSAWISFAGSVIGGTITIIVLYFTVKRAQREAKINKELMLKPTLFFEIANTDKSNNLDLSNNKDEYSRIEWNIRNTSGNPAYNFRIVKERDYILNSNNSYEEIVDDIYTNYGISIFTFYLYESIFIPPNKEQNCYTSFYIDKDEKTKKLWDGKSLKHSILFEYHDASNTRKYSAEFVFEVSFHYYEDDTINFILINQYTKAD